MERGESNHLVKGHGYVNKDITNPGNKAISYAATLSSVVSLLPVRKPGTPCIHRTNGIVSITTTPRNGQWAYGKIPRMFLLYVQTLIRENSPMVDAANKTVHLDETFSSFCEHSGIPVNGRKERVTQMLDNLGGTVIQVTNWFDDGNGKTVHDAINILIADYTHICFDKHSKEYLKGSYIRFSEPMWNILNENPVPLNRNIAFNLGNSARALDIYQWLARRTYYIRRPVVVPWANLQMQFDSADTPPRKFREHFKKALRLVQDNWPELHVETLPVGLKVYSCRKSLDSGHSKTGVMPMLGSPVHPAVTVGESDGNPF